MYGAFSKYFDQLRSYDVSEITEHSHRNHLQQLLQTVAEQQSSKLRILHEPKREGEFGSPDFKVTVAGDIVGYVENKKLEENLDKTLRTSQIQKYKQLSDNLVLTNYIEWIWIKDGTVLQRETLFNLPDLSDKKVKLNSSKAKAVEALLTRFFSRPPKGISDSGRLAKALAIRAKLLRNFLLDELKRQETEKIDGALIGLFYTFRSFVFEELTIDEFADAFSQNLVYGLFLAKLNASDRRVDLYNAKRYIPRSFRLIKELVSFLDELDSKEYLQSRWIVEEVLTVMNNLDLKSIKKDLSFVPSKKIKTTGALKDPYVYFYEDFLTAYDKDLRKAKGVYYTPPPVVGFIVRSLDLILQKTFGIRNGFADHRRVTVLDFATGTGTFILEILQQIFAKLPHASGKTELIIQQHILKNLYGFEYLMAPYTIAHLKLSQFLEDKGYHLQNDDRFQIFLTNTLVPTDAQIKIPLLPALSHEAKQAQKVKDRPILVITGNPPYSKKSRNNGVWIVDLVEAYKYVDGKHFGERQHWLRDDYVKFIRFAQWKMDQVDLGIVGVITNHAFLDNITFRGMRQSLLNTFDQLYFLDLHGSSKKDETPPDGMKNANVFDIEQGVCVSFFIKKNGLPQKVVYSELWGTRHEKYSSLLQNNLATIDWHEINPTSPYYFFYPRKEANKEVYDTFFPVSEIFQVYSLPLMTGRDRVTVKFSHDEVKSLIKYFAEHSEDEIREKYETGTDSRDWSVSKAKHDVIQTKCNKALIRPITYRLFDRRYTYYTGISKGFHASPQKKVVQHMLQPNIGLLVPRQISKSEYGHVFCTALIPEMCAISTATKEQNQLFPLYLYEGSLFSQSSAPKKPENFTPRFRSFIDAKYSKIYPARKIFDYIYAVLYSHKYRKKYYEFLKIDFASIPFPEDRKLFERLSEIGRNLVQAHLMQAVPQYESGMFMGQGSNELTKLHYDPKKRRVYINDVQYFDKVIPKVYQFMIGGYRVIEKYLKARKGRKLSLDEIETVENIVNVVLKTIECMDAVERLTKDWI